MVEKNHDVTCNFDVKHFVQKRDVAFDVLWTACCLRMAVIRDDKSGCLDLVMDMVRLVKKLGT